MCKLTLWVESVYTVLCGLFCFKRSGASLLEPYLFLKQIQHLMETFIYREFSGFQNKLWTLWTFVL